MWKVVNSIEVPNRLSLNKGWKAAAKSKTSPFNCINYPFSSWLFAFFIAFCLLFPLGGSSPISGTNLCKQSVCLIVPAVRLSTLLIRDLNFSPIPFLPQGSHQSSPILLYLICQFSHQPLGCILQTLNIKIKLHPALSLTLTFVWLSSLSLFGLSVPYQEPRAVESSQV